VSGGGPANNEVESGKDAKSGNWIYPSEQMFFDAMRRKNYTPQAVDMHSIVPIHNAVNERAWQEILAWERGQGGDKCGGPRLLSFSGQATALTPKARVNSLLGYTEPFDRHDWVVDRCGTRVEYVIDFYAGKDEGRPGKSLNFYLDVRPKLNTWEGVRMRAARLVGL
jgi:cytochrome c heme-lyase